MSERFIEILESIPEASLKVYGSARIWLQQSARQKPDAKAVHINYARYRLAGADLSAEEKAQADQLIDWVEGLTGNENFSWGEIIMKLAVKADGN